MRKLGKSQEEVLTLLATKSGMFGLSGVSGDLRDVMDAADAGNDRAKLAVDVLVGDIRKYLGAYLVELGGADVIVFTGGIGEFQAKIREMVTANLEQLGIVLDPAANEQAHGTEAAIHAQSSRTQLWVVPTNEELIVARQTVGKVKENHYVNVDH